MAKRFSLREFGLLMAPVLVVGAAGFWASKRPQPLTNPAQTLTVGKISLQFGVEAPTTLEAFRGANAVFVTRAQNLGASHFDWEQVSPFLQVQTPRGVEVSHLNGSRNGRWDEKLWNGGTFIRGDAIRLPVQTTTIPVGEMHFVFFGIAQSNLAVAASIVPVKPLRLSGKWKIDRAQIKAPNLASWPRKPLVVLRAVKITEVYLSPNTKVNGPNSVTGECIFDLQRVAANDKTSFDYDFKEHHFVPRNRSSYGMSSGSSGMGTPETPRTRVKTWTVNDDLLPNRVKVSGRVSADNRWPLGFEIEPFDFKSAKVGQKLKFKQFPVALPKP